MSVYIGSTEITNAYIGIPYPESITLDKSSISLTTIGQTEQLTATIEPTISDHSITWSSDDTSVATVSTTGLVTCVTPGTCTITATTVNGLTATCGVTQGWTPGANTVAYYPLDSTSQLNDMKGSGTAYNFTNLGSTITFGTNQGVDCASFSGGGKCLRAIFGQIYQTLTMSGWFYITQQGNYQGLMLHGYNYGSLIGSWYNSSRGLAITSWASPEAIGNTLTVGRHHICVTQAQGQPAKVYCDNVLRATNSSAVTITGNNAQFVVGGHPQNYNGQDPFYGYASEIIFEDKERAAQEISDYYDQTKSLYGIS